MLPISRRCCQWPNTTDYRMRSEFKGRKCEDCTLLLNWNTHVYTHCWRRNEDLRLLPPSPALSHWSLNTLGPETIPQNSETVSSASTWASALRFHHFSFLCISEAVQNCKKETRGAFSGSCVRFEDNAVERTHVRKHAKSCSIPGSSGRAYSNYAN